MRNSARFAFAFTVVAASASLAFSQTGETLDFSWRSQSGAQPLVSPDLVVDSWQRKEPLAESNPLQAGPQGIRVARNTFQPVSRSAKTFSPSPVKRSPFRVSFRNRQDPDLADAQPSVSDLGHSIIQAPQVPNEIAVAPPGTAVPTSQVFDQGYANAAEPSLSVQSNATEYQTNYCDRDCTPDRCNLGCERRLFGKSCRGLEIGGWANLGYHNRNNIMVNNRKGEANVHQSWLYFDKTAAADSCDWSVGYRADLLYGTDGQDLQAFGNSPTGAPAAWDNTWDNGSYGWALPQLYVQFANLDWDVKVGKFFSPFGYEVIAAPENFFYSHSYTMYFSEPFTMTGILAERRVSDRKTLVLGATAGWDTGFENNNGGNLILGNRFQINDYVNLALTTSYGDTGYRDSGTMTSGVAQLQLTQDVRYVLQVDVLNLKTNNEFGVVQYLFRDVNPCLGLGARLEWWKSDQFFANTKSTYEFTMGANYKVNANVTLRPELRFDWGAAAVDPGTPIIGLDAVMTF